MPRITTFRPSGNQPINRPASHADDVKFYQSKPWRALREQHLRQFPLCYDCEHPANEVHHVKDRRTYPELELEPDNLMSQCTSCHTKRTFGKYRSEGQPLVVCGLPKSGKTTFVSKVVTNGDLVYDLDHIGNALGFPTYPRPKEVADLLIEWRAELIRRIRSTAIKTRVILIVADESQARLIARDIRGKLIRIDKHQAYDID